MQIGGSTREKVQLQDGLDSVGCAPDGHRQTHAQACIHPCTDVHACAKLISTGLGINAQAHECMRPPAQVVTLVLFCAAALIDLSMAQAKGDPPVPLMLACERSIGVWSNRRLPCGAASPLYDVAHQGVNCSVDCFGKLHSCTSVRHKVPGYCVHEHNHRTSAISTHFRTAFSSRSAPLARSPACTVRLP